jgi:hypothetical protein
VAGGRRHPAIIAGGRKNTRPLNAAAASG